MNGNSGNADRPTSLVLASRSPRRTQLLDQLGLAHDVVAADVDERVLPGETAATHVERLAREKALTVSCQRPDAWVIGSDTVVVLDDEILGKPTDAADAARMLIRLQGREHLVLTGVAVARAPGTVASAVECVRVRFRAFDAAFAEAYVATGEPLDKAGAYGIQGRGAALVDSIQGDYFAVMGLPLARLLVLFDQLGHRYDFSRLVEP